MSKATDDLVLLREYLDEVEAMGNAGNLYHPAAKRCADLIERQAREIAELRADKDAYHYERAERAEAERDALREIVKAADRMRTLMLNDRAECMAFDAARAKVQP